MIVVNNFGNLQAPLFCGACFCKKILTKNYQNVMKTNILKLTTILFVFIGCFSSCKKIELVPILPNEEIFAFFEDNLPNISGSHSECFFVGNTYPPKNECIAINSMDEFRRNFFCSPTILPYIDFKYYTLFIGKHQMISTGFKLVEQNIIVCSNKIILNLRTQTPTGTYHVVCPLYYWGIYSKLDNKPIIVKVSDGEYIHK